MPELDTTLDELAAYRQDPPSDPRPIDQLVARVRARRWRRRAGAAGLIVVLLASAGLVVRSSSNDDRADVETADGADTDGNVAAEAETLLIEPATGLRDLQVVGVTLPVSAGFDPAEDAFFLGQCESGAATAVDPVPLCDLDVQYELAEGDVDLRITVRRLIATVNGIIDCADEPERCVLGVRIGSTGRDHIGTISFRSDLRPAAAA